MEKVFFSFYSALLHYRVFDDWTIWTQIRKFMDETNKIGKIWTRGNFAPFDPKLLDFCRYGQNCGLPQNGFRNWSKEHTGKVYRCVSHLKTDHIAQNPTVEECDRLSTKKSRVLDIRVQIPMDSLFAYWLHIIQKKLVFAKLLVHISHPFAR